MSNGTNEKAKAGGVNPQEIVQTISDKVFAAAKTGAVYGEPVVSGNYTVITASEVGSGGGGGGGGGFGPMSENAPDEAQEPEAMGGGSGVGMGGGSFGRPVAVVVIGPEGVEVKPVFDVTKIGLALLTALGGMALMMGRMRRGR